MSVVAYDCSNCGVVPECDVDESGQRICPDCGDAVTGVTKREAEERGDVPWLR